MKVRMGDCSQCSAQGVPIAKRLPSSGDWCVPCNKSRLDAEKEKKAQLGYKNHTASLRRGGRPKGVIQQLVKQLDEVFSIFIRTRHIDESGFVRCCTCRRPYHWKDVDCGHLFPRGSFAIRWDENNANAQCRECNGEPDGRFDLHKSFSIACHGINAIEELESKKNKTYKLERAEMEEKIEIYKRLNQQNLAT